MPAFFSKVFARGKEKEKEKGNDGSLKEPSSPTTKQAKRTSRASAQSLLEGKFEAVSPSVSPTAEKYEEKDQTTPKKDREKEKTGLFRPKSRTTSGSDASRKQEEIPQLKLDLNLSSVKDGANKRDLSVVYESDAILDDAVIGEKRLSPAEALKLMRACSSVLTSRGLETLGVMHPHWHSASPAAQRRIISLFISSLAASPDSSAPSSTFDSELEYARSPHDVAAVFRWALRHLKLEDAAFDKDNTTSLAWYDKFTEKEKAEEYPKNAYSNLLVPAVKPSHAELLSTTLSLISRLASHSEWNGTSGSKLSMFFGHYLLTGNRMENLEDWLQFYNQWERTGRALEHIFLSSLRDEEAKTGIPKRLSELVVNYPYAKSISDSQFPRPTRFATRAYDALYVLVTRESSPGKRSWVEVYQPLQMVENALKSDFSDSSEDKDIIAIWDELKKSSIAPNGDSAPESRTFDKSLSNLLSDESIRILSLKSDSVEKDTPTISMFTSVPEHDTLFGTPTANSRAKIANGSSSVSRQTSEATASSPVASDWNVFSSAGFGESTAGQSLAATLLDNDLEKTEPRPLTPRRSLKKSRSPGRASRADRAADQQPSSPADASVRFKTSRVSLVKIDEAFIDFWSDALLDPISDTWPNFVVCQLKSDVVRAHGDKKVAWLVIEQKFVEPKPPASPQPARRASSPRPSVKSDESRPGIASRVSATFSPRKRFNLFGSSIPVPSTVSGVTKKESKSSTKGTKVNELGEVIPEEKPSEKPKAEKAKAPETKAEPTTDKSKDEAPKEGAKKADEIVASAVAVAVGAGAVAVAAEAAPEAEKTETPAQAPQAEEVKEPTKGGVPDVPPKDVEPEPEPHPEPAVSPPPPPVPEKEVEEPPAVPPADEKPAAEAPRVEPPTAEPAPTQTEAAPAEPAKPAPPEPEATHDEAVKSDVPAAPAPDAAPADVEPAAPVTEEAASSAVEEAVAGVNQGPGDSRFVEHIESSPEIKKPVALETLAEQGDVKQQEEEHLEAAAPAAADSKPPTPAEEVPKSGEKDTSAPVVEEPSVPHEHTTEVHEEVAPPAVEEHKEDETVPVQEDAPTPPPVVEEAEAAPAAGEHRAPVVEEPETAPATEMPAPASSAAEPTDASPEGDAVKPTEEKVEQSHEETAAHPPAPGKNEVSEAPVHEPTPVEVNSKVPEEPTKAAIPETIDGKADGGTSKTEDATS